MSPNAVLDPCLRTAYLDRLGLDAEPPSAGALARLHRAQVERVQTTHQAWLDTRDTATAKDAA